MKTITVKILGPSTPCNNCLATRKNVEEAVKKLNIHDVDIAVAHEDMASSENLAKYGVLKGPAIVAGDYVLFQGMVPPVEKIAKKIVEAAKLM
ncbi:MAG: thioredoxin family protein [Candidatus Lokiarchaeota archaeon]|nr:thioredoxin family protein [Candidatus Lokiarchaeota archaeon]